MGTGSKFNATDYSESDEWKCAFRPESNHYERIGLNSDGQYSTQEIDEAYQVRRNWWRARKQQRDRGQDSNDLIRKVGPYIDDALKNLGEASACLLNAENKRAYDRSIEKIRTGEKEATLIGFITFTLRDTLLTTTEKRDLLEQARELGITRQRAEQLIWKEMAKCGAREVSDEEAISQAASQGEGRPASKVDPPQLVVSQRNFSLGTLRKGEKRECIFATDNKGGGILQGNIEVSDPEWMNVSQPEIDPRRHHQEVTVRIDTSNLALGTNYVGMVEICSNGGRQGVRIDFSIELEESAVSRYRTQLFWMGLLAGGVFGLLLYTLIPDALTGNTITSVAGNLGLIAFVVVCARAGGWGGGIGGFLLAGVSQEILQHVSMRAYSAVAWAAVVSAFLYFCARRLLIANLSGDRRTRAWVAVCGVALVAIIILSGIEIDTAVRPPPNHPTLSIALPVEDKLVGTSVGYPSGIQWVHALGDRGAIFSAADSSRIEYPGLIPPEGTLEFWIKVNSGYGYNNFQLKTNQDVAMIFSSDTQGGDVTWPGTTKFWVSRDGTLSYWMATSKYDKPHAFPTEVRNTKFRFGEWHALGVSYGRQGEYIMLDGKVLASSPGQTQTFGRAGNHQEPLDIPTIGETASHFWAHHRFEGGFEGALAAFRVSARQEDWLLAQGIKGGNASDVVETSENKNPTSAAEVTSTQMNDEDQREHQLTNFRVTVNYDQTVEEMVSAGNFDQVNSDINSEHFPVNHHGTSEVEMVLVLFNVNDYISSDIVMHKLDKMGLRPANLLELLAFGAAYPNEQRKARIVALGSVWHRPIGDRFMPYLDGDPVKRGLNLNEPSWAGWLDEFAAVRKPVDVSTPSVTVLSPTPSKLSSEVKAPRTTATTFHVKVNYDRTVEEMVRAGKYNWVASNVDSKHFPTNRHGTSEVEMVVIDFDHKVGSDEVLSELDKMGLRPAELLELLAFDSAYPETGRTFVSPIIALGSVHPNGRGGGEAISLENGVLVRLLQSINVSWYGEWGSSDRFAAVRK